MKIIQQVCRYLRSSCVPLTLILTFVSGFAAAQTNQGQLSGNVVDASGAQVAGAKITAKNEATGTTYNTVSTSAGSYRFPSIELGRYTITTTATGFSSAVSTGVEVRVGSVTGFDIHLAVGGTAETVTVAANAPTIETQSSDIGGTVTTRQIVDLPLALGGVGAMRSPEAFIFLIPGTTGPGSANSPNGIFISKLGGGQNFGNEVLLDGASQTRSENGSSFDEEAPSVEAISEFKVTTSTPAAEFGRTTGGIENFVTKSGTNSFHGTAFNIFKNEALDANAWFNNGRKAFYQSVGNPIQSSFNRPTDKKNDYGGSFGGPVFIPHVYHGGDRSFFFFAWEQYRQRLGGTTTSSVPTLAERTGDFSDRLIGGPNGSINPCDGTSILNGQIFDPATETGGNGIRCRTAFPGNKIPQGRFSKVAQNIAAYYPAPTSSALTNNYALSSSSSLTNTTYTVRIDQSVGASDKLFGSYSSRQNTRNSPTNLTLPFPVDPDTQVQDFITHFGRGGWDHVFGPNLLNHLNLGFNRSNSINGSIAANTGINYASQLGIGNITTGFPRINADGYVSLSRNQNDDNIDNGVRVNDSVSYQRGRNSFKFGVDYRYQQYSAITKGLLNGLFNFTTRQTQATQTGSFLNGTGNGVASLLLGGADFGQVSIPFHQARWISNYWAVFAQDDFKVSNRLVLNLGLRYSIDQPRREAGNFTSNFSQTAIDPKNGLPGALVFASNCTNCNKRWADTWFKDFAPRVGFAYTPDAWNSKLVVRGGFSTLYAPLQYADFGGDTRTGYTANPTFGSNGFDPAFEIDSGLPAFTAGINLDPGQLDNGNANAPNHFGNFIKSSYGRPGQVNQWNLQIQQELAKDLIITVGYIGSAGSHLRSSVENINNMPRSNFARGDALLSYDLAANGISQPFAAFNGQVQQALRPFPQYGYIATDCCLQNVGHSSYNALVATLERRFSQGLNLQASYTWSHTITNADSALPGINGGVSQIQDPFNSKSQKSLSIQDIPNTFVVSYLYELPFGENKRFFNQGRLLNTFVGGFSVGGVQRYQSGQPISFAGADGIPGWDNFIAFTRLPGSKLLSPARRNGHIDPFRNLRAGGNVSGPDPNVDSEFNGLFRRENPGYSALQTEPALYSQNQGPNRILRARQVGSCPTCDNGDFEFGNVPRVTGEARNYRYLNEDFSILKTTPITERVNFVLKVELLNAFNRHVFSVPNPSPATFLNPYDNFFGVPTDTINLPRQIQLTGRISF
ncbi:MAG TPA: TonB-dependent receptor [Edaphobacter sp.]|nr:TonB-dependent receptor [Edaphobacter sp.]